MDSFRNKESLLLERFLQYLNVFYKQILVAFAILCNIGVSNYMMHNHFSAEDPFTSKFQRNYGAFGFNTLLELIQGKKPDPVANFIGGFRNPGVSMNTTPVQGKSAPLDYSTKSTGGSTNPSNVQYGPVYNGPVAPAAQTGGGNGGGGQVQGAQTSGGGGGIDFGALIDQARQRSRGIYNEGMSALQGKRKQFSDIFEQGKGDILQGFEKGAGELQASATGARERNANALRALGLGGSAVVRSQGREKQAEAKGLANLQDIRGQNERGNQEAFQSNTDWANSQESGLNQFLQNADAQANQGAFSLLDNILSSQIAANAARGQYTPNATTVNIPNFMNYLTGISSNAGLTGSQNPNENVSINEQPTTYFDWLKRNVLRV